MIETKYIVFAFTVSASWIACAYVGKYCGKNGYPLWIVLLASIGLGTLSSLPLFIL